MNRSFFALAVIAALSSCTDTKIEPLAAANYGLDDRVTVQGTICTKPPDTDGFPVKVVFIIDKSGSMCITDPPGSQSDVQSICQTFANSVDPTTHPDNYCEPDGNAHPGRTCAVYDLLNTFKDQPNVSALLIPFETKISGEFPENGGFQPINDGNFDQWVGVVNDMQSSLGQGTDYQGAFAEAYSDIAADIEASPKSIRPRTRYVVVFLTDGTPFPRCASDDYLPLDDYATPADPDLIWADSEGAGCTTPPLPPDPNNPDGCFCNADQSYITGVVGDSSDFTTGTDRNQNYQIYDLVDRIEDLKTHYNISDISVNAILLWNTANINSLNLQEQQDLFGDMGNVANPIQAEHDVAEHLLREISETHGHGTYQEFNTVAQIQLGSLDYTSLVAPFVLKSLIVTNTSADPRPDGQVPDSDGDGLPDDIDNDFVAHTSRFLADSDGDGLDDHFEWTHQAEGYNPSNDPDPRGCIITAVINPTCSCDDTDGDGLSECEELAVGSDSTLVDSDTDGIPDGLEVRYGTNPAVAESNLQDSDGDGNYDLDEIKAHTDPLVADAQLAETDAYQYQIVAHVPDGGITCYDYAVSNIKLVTPQAANGVQHGINNIQVYFDQAPASDITNDYGEWRMACAIAQYAPPSVRQPQGPSIKVDDASFVDASVFKGATPLNNACVVTP